MDDIRVIDTNLLAPYTGQENIDKIVLYPTLKEMWEHCESEYADKIAIQDGQEYSYKTLGEDVAKFRGVLVNNGVKKGDRVCVLAPSSYDFAKVFFAIETLGAVAVLLPVQLDEKTIFGCSKKFNANLIVCHETLTSKAELAKSLGVNVVLSSETADAVPAGEISPDDESVIIFTGGTTGRSKGALLSHKAVMNGVVNGCYGTKEVFDQRYFLILPLTHVFGLIRNFLTCFYTGSVIFICRDLKNMFKEMAQFSPTVLIMVPALIEMALNLSKQIGKHILGSKLKTIIAGASTVGAHLIKEFNELGVTVLPGYGLTESANLVSGNPESLKKPTSVGLPYPNQQLRIVNGELWIKGDNVMLKYDGDEEETANAFEDGWFKTGDLVRFDEDGYLYIVGRIKDVIVLDSGEKVSPAELEDKFCEPDYIADAMVYEDEDNGVQCLTLEVVLRTGASVEKEKVLEELNAINDTLYSYQKVNKIIIRDTDFERTPAMKKIRIKKK